MISREAINREIDRIDGRLKVLETILYNILQLSHISYLTNDELTKV